MSALKLLESVISHSSSSCLAFHFLIQLRFCSANKEFHLMFRRPLFFLFSTFLDSISKAAQSSSREYSRFCRSYSSKDFSQLLGFSSRAIPLCAVRVIGKFKMEKNIFRFIPGWTFFLLSQQFLMYEASRKGCQQVESWCFFTHLSVLFAFCYWKES